MQNDAMDIFSMLTQETKLCQQTSGTVPFLLRFDDSNSVSFANYGTFVEDAIELPVMICGLIS